MIQLIDTPEFQRLRRIKQLGLGLYTYQGAEHSRFTHSLGALHLMTRILDQLSARIAPADRAAARAAALLHDIGHGPFSHAMEKVLGVHHEQMTMLAVTSPESALNATLKSFSDEMPHRVASIIDGTFKPAALAQLLQAKGDTRALAAMYAIDEMAQVAAVRQREARGLGHAVLMSRQLVGDEPFCVFLPDDIIHNPGDPCTAQLLHFIGQHDGMACREA